MKKFKPNYSFADLWKQFVMFTKNWRRKSTGELVNKDTLELTGDVKCFENIVDKDGHKRFIEGDITVDTITGVTQTYGKWSLSGTHLMIVVGLAIANETTIPAGYIVEDINIPSWILDKCIPLWSNNIIQKVFTTYSTDATTQEMNVILDKDDGKLNIYNYMFAATKDRNVRIQFDLLIDNAESE